MDGFPRTQAQKHRHWQYCGITALLVFLEVPDEVLEKRVNIGVGRRTDSLIDLGNFFLLEQFHANAEAVKGSYAVVRPSKDVAKKRKREEQ